MRTLAAIAVFLLAMVPAQARTTVEDFTGKWAGAFNHAAPDGSVRENQIELNLKHTGKELTGTAGPSAAMQWPIVKGVVDDNKLTFDVQAENGPLISFVLTYADGHLKGDANAEDGGEKRTAKIDAQRVK